MVKLPLLKPRQLVSILERWDLPRCDSADLISNYAIQVAE